MSSRFLARLDHPTTLRIREGQNIVPQRKRVGGISFEIVILLGAAALFGTVIAFETFEPVSGARKPVDPAGAVREIVSFGDSSELAVRYATHCVLWNPQTTTSRPVWLPPCEHRCAVLAGSPTHSRILVGWGDGWLNLRDAFSGRVVWRSCPVGFEPTSAIFSPDGTSLAVTSSTGELALLDAETGKTRWKTPVTNLPRMTACFSAEGNRIFTVDQGRRLVALDANTGERIKEILVEQSRITAIAAAPDGRHLVVSSLKGELVLWDFAKEQIVYREKAALCAVLATKFSPDGRHLIYATTEGKIAAMELGGKYRHRVIGEHDDSVFAMTTRGETLVTGSTDGEIRVWPDALGRRHP